MQDIEGVIARLTLRQKARLCQGMDAWSTYPIKDAGVPSAIMADGPHGLRKQYNKNSAILDASIPATCFPTASATACSFDRGLLYDIGKAIGEEARDQGVSLVLGPGVNIKRSPLCGRNFEYFSEDPLLSGEMGAAIVSGIQSTGTGACVKHYAANNREYFRMVCNSIIDGRALHEIYLAPFRTVIEKSAPFAVMSAYNRLNAEYCGESRALIEGILRGQMGFGGVVISDWGACCDRVAGIDAGMDIEMPHSGAENTENIDRAVQDGRLDEARLDACVRRILEFVFRCARNEPIPYRCDFRKHHELARHAAVESAVLLKNEKSALPLPPRPHIALIGGFVQAPRYQGAGSSVINPIRLEGVSEQFIRYGIHFRYALGYEAKSLQPDQALIDEAVAVARECGVAVVFAGIPSAWEIEGIDRQHLNMPDAQNALIDAVSQVAKTIVVLMGGGPVEMPWIGKVDAVLQMHLGGQAVASAIAELLTGISAPGGRLAETYPLSASDVSSHQFFSDDIFNVEYRESIYVGYRYFDAIGRDVLFPFGHGLAYTTFEYMDFAVEKDRGRHTVNLTFSITNTGGRKGAEVPQVYLLGATCRDKKLASFDKVFLKPGETAALSFILTERDFCFYDDGWQLENKELLVGRSSRDILYRESIEFPDAARPRPYAISTDGHWDSMNFYSLFDKIPLAATPHKPFGLNATLTDLEATRMGSLINLLVEKFMEKKFHPDADELNVVLHRIIKENPFRALVSMSGGMFSYDMARAALTIANGRPVTGVFKWIGATARGSLAAHKNEE